jgi:hypothetical protein
VRSPDPIVDRLFHTRLHRAFTDFRPRVVHAVADDGPAVVLAGLHPVQLVAATRPVLHDPQLPGLGVERGALDVAMAVRPDLGLRPGAAGIRRSSSEQGREEPRHGVPEPEGGVALPVLCNVELGAVDKIPFEVAL